MTPTATAEALSPPEVALPEAFPRHRLTVERYLRMVESGAFGENEPLILWDGELVETMTKGPQHSFLALKLSSLLNRIVPDEFHVEIEQPLRLDDHSMPEPDVMIVSGALERFVHRRPDSPDVALIIEVSDSSLKVDSTQVKRAYARCSIPEYWIVNVPGRCVEVHKEPSGPAEVPDYRSSTTHGVDRTIPVILEGREVGRVLVADLFLSPPPG